MDRTHFGQLIQDAYVTAFVAVGGYGADDQLSFLCHHVPFQLRGKGSSIFALPLVWEISAASMISNECLAR